MADNRFVETTRGSEWLALRRCLAILRRLKRSPASARELLDAVCILVGSDAYPAALKARRAAFKHDREKLRNVLEVNFVYDAREQKYVLLSAGPWGCLDLDENHLRALKLLVQSFAGEVGERAEVFHLLDHLISQLPEDAQRKLDRTEVLIDLDVLKSFDDEGLSERVWQIVRRGVAEQRKLAFDYLSPQQADRQPRYHVVAPLRVRFRDGHWYLHASDLFWRNPHGIEARDTGIRRFRLSYILDNDKLQILPSKFPPVTDQFNKFLVYYRLLPPVSRGHISAHFNSMQVQRFPDGAVEVRAVTDDAWEAVRILLGYGEFCVVLGDETILRMMRKRVLGMIENYQ